MASVFDVYKIRNFSLFWVFLALLFTIGCTKNSEQKKETTVHKFFVARYSINRVKLDRIYCQKLEKHGFYFDSLNSENLLLYAGPLNDSTGMAVYKAEKAETVEEWIQKDPAVIEQLLFYTLQPWDVVIGRTQLLKTHKN